MSQRVERAVLAVGGVARVHVNRWGDGGTHLHFWLPARPAGLRAHRRITAAPAAGGGTA